MANLSGQNYERDFCKRLSLWYSEGKDDDLFWRSSMSGGRATVRSKQGKKTAGHYGDIVATDKRGIPLVATITFELKTGYNKDTTALSDLLDVLKGGAVQMMGTWIKQARKSSRLAGSTCWLIVYQKKRRREVIIMPRDFFNNYFMEDTPHLAYTGPVRTGEKTYRFSIVAVRASEFFKLDPRLFRS